MCWKRTASVFDNPITRLINAVLNAEFVIGGAGTGPINNTTQISFLSFNIFNPQTSIFGGNLSNNTTNSNIASGYGNNTATSATSVPNFWTSWFGGMTGNGNITQFAFFSGDIFNPQYSLFGPNVSNNTALTNVATENGNDGPGNPPPPCTLPNCLPSPSGPVFPSPSKRGGG